jgi:exonuclease SbcC
MNLMIQTQKASKSKQSDDDVIETLDIIVRDDLGERSLEMYSGGESFKVSFALRIGLSKLLARRAGADLQTLIIDEGFGSQDSTGRERLVDSIMAIRQDFARILVITHVDELKDAFANRIEIVKTPSGSVAIPMMGIASG